MLLARARACAVMAALLVLALSGNARAQTSFPRQVELLKTDEDLRVRTQAALALGASANPAAVAPLCGALDDANYIVRMAAALALSKLQRGGLNCVQRRLEVEKVSSVVYTLQSSLARLEEGPPVITDSTRYYIALANTVHSTGREQVPRIVRRRMREVAGGLGGIAIAPSDETPDQAEIVFQKYKRLKGFYLAPKLTVTYGDGRLSLKLNIAMLSYPGKNLLGQFSRSVASPGISKPDPATEDELLAVAAESALKQFASVAPNL